MIKNISYQIILIILTLWLVTFETCIKDSTPHNARQVKQSPNGDQVKLLMEEAHSKDHDLHLDIFEKRLLPIGEEAIAPLLEAAKNYCEGNRGGLSGCRGYIDIGLILFARNPETRNSVYRAIAKELLEFNNTEYICFLLHSIDSAHNVLDSSGKWIHLPLAPDLVSAIPQLLPRSDYLDSAVQLNALHILDLYDIPVREDVRLKAVLDSLSSKQIYVRYRAVYSLALAGHEWGHMKYKEVQNALYEHLQREKDPAVREKIVEALMTRYDIGLDKGIISTLLVILMENEETGEVSSRTSGEYSVDGGFIESFPFEDTLLFLTKLTGEKFGEGEITHKSKIEEKREVIKKWSEWWTNNKDFLQWDYRRKVFRVVRK